MNTHFEKELERVYLVFDSEITHTDEYLLQMPLRCALTSLLPLSVITRDNRSLLRADVTACTSLAARYQCVPLTGVRIRSILHTLRDLALRLPKYLLDPRDLYLDPESVFLGAGQDELLVCYVPHLSDSEPHTIRLLSEFFLKKIDHSDTIAAGLAYQLFNDVSSDRYILGDVFTRLLDTAGRQDPGMTGPGARPSAVQAQDQPYSQPQFADPDPSSLPNPGYNPSYSFGSAPPRAASRMDSGRQARQAAPRMDSGRQTRQAAPQMDSGRQARRSAPRSVPRSAPRSVRSTSRSYRRNRRSGEKLRYKGQKQSSKKSLLIHFLPYLLICGSAVLVIFIFHFDLTQIGGMGFLCAALIWMVHNAKEKHRSDIKNVWADEDDPGDDQFYQQLLREVYAEDPDLKQSVGILRDEYRPSPPSADPPAPQRSPGPAPQSFPDPAPQGFHCPAPQDSPDPATQSFPDPAPQGFHCPAPQDSPDPATQSFPDPAPQDFPGPDAKRPPQYPRLLSLQKERCPDLTISADHILLGKSRRSADAVLPDQAVSRIHARIEQRTDGYYITDLFSTNGTALNGKKLEPGQAYLLQDGAVLAFAALRYQVSLPAA